MPPMGDAKHPLGGKGTIPMTLRDNPPSPTKPVPSTLGAQGFATHMQYFG